MSTAIYTITTSNWDDPSFWSSISETGIGNELDCSFLPSAFTVTFDARSGLVTITDGSTTFTIGDATYGGSSDASLGGSTEWTFFDTYVTSDGGDDYTGGDGVDSVESGDGDDTLSGGGDDWIDGWNGDDSIDGGDGNDEIYGYDGNDTIDGDAGKDTIKGEDGDDLLDGGAGDDTVEGGHGNDTIISGNDASSVSAITVNDGDDLTGTSGVDAFEWAGGAGNSATIRFNNSPTAGDGDGEADFVYVTTTDDAGTLTIDDFDVGTDKIYVQESWVGMSMSSSSGYAYITLTYANGSQQSFEIYHDNSAPFSTSLVFSTAIPPSLESGSDSLSGGDDADTFIVQDGFGNDTVDGGSGGTDDDTIDLSALSGPVTITYDDTADGAIIDGSDTIALEEIENITATHQGDSIDGSADQTGLIGDAPGVDILGLGGDDTITGGRGGDTIDGGEGADSIVAGYGDDSVLGGNGADTLYGDGPNPGDVVTTRSRGARETTTSMVAIKPIRSAAARTMTRSWAARATMRFRVKMGRTCCRAGLAPTRWTAGAETMS
ncbi:hypothetical protein A8B78_21625 [Jannaschia sp. EhC01]|nr:hypothetical protein A8B78_21625 [Jannaschia sp. EhC01]